MNTLEHALIMPVLISVFLSICSLAFFLHDCACIEILRGIWIEQEELNASDIKGQIQQQFFLRQKVNIQVTDVNQKEIKVSSESIDQTVSIDVAPAIESLQRYKVILDSVEDKLERGNEWK